MPYTAVIQVIVTSLIKGHYVTVYILENLNLTHKQNITYKKKRAARLLVMRMLACSTFSSYLTFRRKVCS